MTKTLFLQRLNTITGHRIKVPDPTSFDGYTTGIVKFPPVFNRVGVDLDSHDIEYVVYFDVDELVRVNVSDED